MKSFDILKRAWLFKGLTLVLEWISMKVYEVYGLIIEYEVYRRDVIMFELLLERVFELGYDCVGC